jgi:HSP20 family protein
VTTLRYRRQRGRWSTEVGGERRVTAIEWWRLTGTVVVTPGAWRPRADILETPDAILISVELAGVEPDAIDVQLFDDVLVVDGQRSIPGPFADGFYHAAEIPRGRFRFRVDLPAAIDPDRAEARVDRGLLELTLPKSEEAGGGH